MERIGRYTLGRRLGSGAMGVVFEAHDDRMNRPVAIKLLHASGNERAHARLHREAQALARLNHPHVVTVFEVGVHRRRAFLVMERVEGTTLERWLEAERRTVPQIVDVFVAAGEGLAAAHAAGLIHRDFKPSNVLVGRDGRVRVLDFGLAQTRESLDDDEPLPPALAGAPAQWWSQSLTRTGKVMGTPAYMAPERYHGHPADEASDQFSYCVALYGALYRQHPFADTDHWPTLLSAIMGGTLRAPPEHHDVPPELERIVHRGLVAEPEGRWPSMRALLDALAQARRPRRRWRWLIPSALAASLALALGGSWPGDDGSVPPDACSDASLMLAQAWGPASRAQLEQTFMGSTLPFAAPTWARVEPRLDDYADRWARAYAQACAVEREPQDRTPLACLEQRRRVLAAQVQGLSGASAGSAAVIHAVPAVMRLEPPETCLEATGSVMFSARPAAGWDPLERELERVEVLSNLGLYAEAQAQAAALVGSAQTQGYVRLEAVARLRLGTLHAKLDEQAKARGSLERAYFLARELGLDAVALRAAVKLIDVVGVEQQEHEAGLEWSRHAQAEVDRGAEERDEARYLNRLGLLLIERRELEPARVALERALAIERRVLGDEHPDTADTMDNLSIALRRLHRVDEASEYKQQVLAINEEVYGPTHPVTAQALSSLATVQVAMGHLEEAEQGLRRSIEITQNALGPDNGRVVFALNNLAMVLSRRGEHAEAEHTMNRALTLGEATGRPLFVANLTTNLATIQRAQGDLTRAMKTHRRGLAILREAGREEHPDFVHQLISLARTQIQLGRSEAAQQTYLDALAHLEAHPGVPYVSVARAELAMLDMDQGHPSRAMTLAQRVLDDAASAPLTRQHEAMARFVLAQMRWQAEPAARAEARARADAALALVRDEPSDAAFALESRIEDWLALHPLDPAAATSGPPPGAAPGPLVIAAAGSDLGAAR